MKTRTLSQHTRPLLTLLLLCLPLRAEDEIEKAFRDALYAEEVKGDTEAALKAYQDVAAKFEQQRDMAATALFRQAECLRKLGRKDEAAALYNKVLTQYGDKERSAKLSRENLAALGMAPAASATGNADSPAASAAVQEAAEVARLEKLLKDSPDLINATDASNPLAAAAEKGQVALVDYLLGKGARVDTLVDGKAALHRAAEAGHLTVCQKLIEKGADVNLETTKEATALLLALDKGRFSIVELLLEKKADVNAGSMVFVQPAKYSGSGKLESNEVREEFPALMTAFRRSAPAELLQRLISDGADVTRPAERSVIGGGGSWWPLGEALRLRNEAVIAAMLAKGAAVTGLVTYEAGKEDVWAMDMAMEIAKPSSPEATDDPVVELLRKHGADLKREQVMQKAIENGLTGYIRAAVKDGASPNRLVKAIGAGKYDALKVLIEAGADPAGEQTENDDPLTAAVYRGSADAVKMLLDAGYPLKDRLVKVTSVAARGAFPADRKPNAAARAIYDQMAGEAKKAGVLEEALTKTLSRMVDYPNPPLDTAALLAAGANAAKSEALSKLFQNQGAEYGLGRSDYMDLWKAARISQNPELHTAVWVSRGPSLSEAVRRDINVFNRGQQNSRGQQNYPTFFRAVVSETGIVPAGTVGRLLAAYGWDSDRDDLTSLTVYRLDAERKIQELKVDFTAIAKAGDAAKDFPLQWGDVVEIPPRAAYQQGTDSQADAARQTERDAILKFMDALYAETDTRLFIGDSQLIVNAENEKGPVLRMKGTRDPLAASGLPATSDPLPELESMSAGQPVFSRQQRGPGAVRMPQLYISHGDSVRIVPPALEPALNDTALRNAFTLAVSEKGPYLRVLPGMTATILGLPHLGRERGSDLLRASPANPAAQDAPPPPMPRGLLMPQEMPARSLRDVLLMLRGPNFTGFGPVNWPAAKLRLANKDGWEDLDLDKADQSWPIVPGMMLILPPLDPANPIPPDTFDYAACAMEVEVTPGDLPPFKLRFQPPVPELKRAGDKWLWSYNRKDGDSPCAWPDLYTLLSNAPALKDWPGYTGEITLKSGQKYSFDKNGLQNSGGLWLQPDWKGISLMRTAATVQPNPGSPAQGLQIPSPQPSLNNLPIPNAPIASPGVPTSDSAPPPRGRTRVVSPPPSNP